MDRRKDFDRELETFLDKNAGLMERLAKETTEFLVVVPADEAESLFTLAQGFGWVVSAVDKKPVLVQTEVEKPQEPSLLTSLVEVRGVTEGKGDPGKGVKKTLSRKVRSSCPHPDNADAVKAWAELWSIPDPYTDLEAWKFLNHHAAKGSLFKDWGLAWKNWKSGRFVPKPKEVLGAAPSLGHDGQKKPKTGDWF